MSDAMEPVLHPGFIDLVPKQIARDADQYQYCRPVAMPDLDLQSAAFEIVDEGPVFLKGLLQLCMASGQLVGQEYAGIGRPRSPTFVQS